MAVINSNTELRISHIRESDLDEYTCVARNGVEDAVRFTTRLVLAGIITTPTLHNGFLKSPDTTTFSPGEYERFSRLAGGEGFLGHSHLDCSDFSLALSTKICFIYHLKNGIRKKGCCPNKWRPFLHKDTTTLFFGTFLRLVSVGKG